MAGHPPGRARRALALVVAAAFLAFAVGYGLLVAADDEVTWQMVILLAVVVVGSGTLAAGAVSWYGRTARKLRITGVILLVVAAAGTVSFAFVLVPLAVLAAISLRLHRLELRPH
jgi:hypothetical protein